MPQKKPKKKKCKACGKPFPVFNSTQQACGWRCALRLVKIKKQKNHDRIKKTQEPDKLKRKANALYQKVGKKLKPLSILSGQPTEVIHHFIFKSHSNNLKHDLENGIPLTNDEHATIHGPRRASLELKICIAMGKEWQKRIDEKSKIRLNLSTDHLKEVIAKFEEML